MKKMLFLLLILPLQVMADISSVKSCLVSKYTNLKEYNAIVAAVVSRENSEIMTFGNAKVDQIFEIASITKTMTGTLLAQAILDKKVNLADPIPDNFQKSGEKISYKHLTTHTSGLNSSIGLFYDVFNNQFAYDGLTKEKFLELYPKIDMDFRPGEKFSYSNTGVALLGLLLEKMYDRNYESLVQNYIFDTLGMKESFFEVPAPLMHRFPKGNVNGEVWPYWDLFKTAFNPAGGVRSTISDMILYARASLTPDNSKFGKAIELSQRPIFQRDHRWIGMNWMMNPDRGTIFHDGTTIAFNSVMVISKKSNLAVVMMTDTGWYDVNGQRGFDFTLEDAAFDCLLNP